MIAIEYLKVVDAKYIEIANYQLVLVHLFDRPTFYFQSCVTTVRMEE